MSKKVKICFVILGTMYSGAEVVLNRFLKESREIDPYVLLIYKNDEVKNKIEDLYGIERTFSLDFKYIQNNITFMPDLERLRLAKKYKFIVNMIKPDLIYINNTTETMLVGGMIKNLPSICHIHDMKSLSRSPIRIAATLRGINNCTNAVTVSKACKEDWGMKMDIIYNGLDEEIFNYKKIESIRNIGFIGTPIKRKGIDIILESLDGLLSRNNRINFKFAFNQELDSELNLKMTQLCEKYKDRIMIFKELSEEEVLKFYDETDLIVVPSRHDPLPTVIMEAEARGTLVIGNNTDGIPELLNNKSELIIDDINSEKLTYKIENLLQADINYINKLTEELFQYSKEVFSSRNKERKLMNLIYKSL